MRKWFKQTYCRPGLIDSLGDFFVLKIVKEPGNLESATLELEVDVIVVDISDKDPELIHLLENIKLSTEASFLIISNSQNKGSIQRLLGMGINGIVTKSCSEEEIVNALRTVRKGNRFFCDNILDLVMESQSEEEDCDPTDLPPREYEVLKLITKGNTTNQIAEHLHLSVHTINSHRKNMLRKLKISSPTELIVYALESGLVK